MRSAAFAFGTALLLAAALTPLVRRMAVRLGAIDSPGERRVNVRQIPRLGGIAVVLAFFLPLVALFVLDSSVGRVLFSDPLRVVGLFAGSLIVTTLGALDDLRGVRAWHKLWVHVAAAVVAFYCGFRIDAVALPLLGHLPMGIFALPVTVFWIVAVINAMNLIDGLDGLAGGVAFFVCVTNFVVALLNGSNLVVLSSACLAGALLGFLVYNWNPATIFMGDSGSMFLGFILATMSMLGASVKSTTTVALLVPLVSLGLPIIDTLFAMVRRYLERRPIFSPDNGHIHHRLLAVGITHKRAVLMLYGVCVLLTAGAVAISVGRSWQVGGAVLVLSVVLFGVVRFARYFELARAGRRSVERMRAPEVERIRQAIPDAVLTLHRASTPAKLRMELEEFAEAAGILELHFVASADAKLESFDWYKDPSAPSPAPREVASTRCAVPSAGTDASLRFVWPSGESYSVSPQIVVLLQLVSEVFDARLTALTARSEVTELRPATSTATG
ncbi:MAG: MraY family glycosyltransferase [Polyangiales bacterium]|nr:undecaprenyl/decaprenyl-phosphate alpha-N-acetylglucosaminyl 1-phosphate transferase [Myxococcales bacterium]